MKTHLKNIFLATLLAAQLIAQVAAPFALAIFSFDGESFDTAMAMVPGSVVSGLAICAVAGILLENERERLLVEAWEAKHLRQR